MKLEQVLRSIADACGADAVPLVASVRKPHPRDDGVEITITDGDKKHVYGISSSPVFGGGLEVVVPTREATS